MIAVPPALRTYRVPGHPGARVVLASAGLACCAMEVESAARRGLIEVDESPLAPADRAVLVVAGTVTEALAPAVRRLLADLPAGTRVVSFGACAATGGPYWDAPTVIDGVDGLLSVDRWVPGCPPRPSDLVAGLVGLLEQDPA